MVGNVFSGNESFAKYFSGVFPGFGVAGDSDGMNFYNPELKFLVIPYLGGLVKGISLGDFNLSKTDIPSISFIGLNTPERDSFQMVDSYLINNELLSKFVKNLAVRCEREKIPPIMKRADLSDLFSGRTLLPTITSSCPNGFTLQSCPQGVQPLRGILLDHNSDGKVLDYLCSYKLI